MVCLLDNFNDAGAKQRLDDLIKQKIVSEKKIFYFGSYSKGGHDLEDLFTKEEYLHLFNCAFKGRYEVKITDIKGIDKPILPQINNFLGIERFNHYLPAEVFLRIEDKSAFLSNESLDRFKKVFDDVSKQF